MDLIDKRIIVTGCARGMGAATVRAYVNAGAQVVGMDLTDEAGEAVCTSASRSASGKAVFMHVDVADKASVTGAFSAAVEQLGGLDALAHPAASAYSTSKGAVHAWTRTAAGTWGKDSVRVNAILPAIATPMYNEARARSSARENELSYWRNLQSIALGEEYGDPDRDLGPVMVFMASDASRFITGQLIPVDGGQHNVR